jgi:hypothetical protein
MEPPILTPSEWLDQVNYSDDPAHPDPDLYRDFDPGDTIYLEGKMVTVWFNDESELYMIEVSDNERSCYFQTDVDITGYQLDEHLYFKIEIREPQTSEGSFILSGNNPNYFDEEAALVDIQKEHHSFKMIYMVCGFVIIALGLVLTFYTDKFRKKKNEPTNKEIKE